MKSQISMVFAALLFVGCAVFEKGALVTLVALSQARTDGVLILTKADKLRQAEFRDRARVATNKLELETIEGLFYAHNMQIDRTLLGFEALGKSISLLKNALKSGAKLDLSAAIKAYKDLESLMTDMHLELPKIPGVN